MVSAKEHMPLIVIVAVKLIFCSQNACGLLCDSEGCDFMLTMVITRMVISSKTHILNPIQLQWHINMSNDGEHSSNSR